MLWECRGFIHTLQFFCNLKQIGMLGFTYKRILKSIPFLALYKKTKHYVETFLIPLQIHAKKMAATFQYILYLFWGKVKIHQMVDSIRSLFEKIPLKKSNIQRYAACEEVTLQKCKEKVQEEEHEILRISSLELSLIEKIFVLKNSNKKLKKKQKELEEQQEKFLRYHQYVLAFSDPTKFFWNELKLLSPQMSHWSKVHFDDSNFCWRFRKLEWNVYYVRGNYEWAKNV